MMREAPERLPAEAGLSGDWRGALYGKEKPGKTGLFLCSAEVLPHDSCGFCRRFCFVLFHQLQVVRLEIGRRA